MTQGNYLQKLCDAIVETVKETGANGAPSGPIYAAVMAVGVTLEQYEGIMARLVTKGLLRKSGHVYYYVGKDSSPRAGKERQ